MKAATSKTVTTIGMQYAGDNADGSFALNWRFQHGDDTYTVTIDPCYKARGTEATAHRACVGHINGKSPTWPVRAN